MTEPTTSTPETVSNSFKISSNKILKINEECINLINDEVQVLHMQHESIKKAAESFEKIKSSNLPNIFAVQIEIDAENIYGYRKLLKKVKEFIKDMRPFLLQIYNKEEDITFIRKRSGEFEEFERKNKMKELTSKFSIQNFLAIQNCALIDADLNKFATFSHLKLEQLLMMAINSGDELCFRILNLFEPDFVLEDNKKIFSSVIKSKNFQIFLFYLNVYEESEVTLDNVRSLLSFEVDTFEMAVRERNSQVIRFLLKFRDSFQNFFNFSKIKNAYELCIKNCIFEVFFELKRCQFDYFSSDETIALRNLNEENEKIIGDIHRFFEDIKMGNLQGVKGFVIKYPSYKLCYSSSGVSALEHAISHKKFEVFSILMENGFCSDVSNFTDNEREAIREHYLEYELRSPDAFIQIFKSKCKISKLSPFTFDDISKMLEQLSKLPDIRPFLEIAAHLDAEFIFDYSHGVEDCTHLTGEQMQKTANFRKKNLYYFAIDGRNTSYGYGSFVHNLIHEIFDLIYENKCLPYCEDDQDRKTKYEEICREKTALFSSNKEEPVSGLTFEAFLYTKNVELAVLVPEMVAHFSENPTKLKEREETFRDFFDFHRNIVLSDLKIPNICRFIKLNNHFGVIEAVRQLELNVKSPKKLNINISMHRRIILSSNVPILTLSIILDQVRCLPGNKLNLKTRNIFVDLEELRDTAVIHEFRDLMQNSEIERIFIMVENFEDEILDFLVHSARKSQIFIITNQKAKTLAFSDKFGVASLKVSHKWNDLTEEAKEKIRKQMVEFNGMKIELSNMLDITLNNIEIFPFLCSKKPIKINSFQKIEMKNYIGRVILKAEGSNFEPYHIENFIESTRNDKVVLISDVAGSGKTTFLRTVPRTLVRMFPNYWISFIDLKSVNIDLHNQITKSLEEDVQNFIAKILYLDTLESKIFFQKFDKGEVIILFDGFDEVPPMNNENCLKFFKKFVHHGKNQMWITTRPTGVLENVLNVSACRLKELDKSEQIEFLIKFWENSHEDKNYIRSCALKLIQEMSNADLLKTGNVLTLRMMGEYFQNKIDKKFEERIKLSYYLINKIAIENSDIFLLKSSEENLNLSESILRAHHYFAVKNCFGDEYAKDLGLSIDKISLKEVERFGMLKFGKNDEIHFSDKTFAEFFLASVVFNIIQYILNPSEAQLDFLVKILSRIEFRAVRTTLDGMLKKHERSTLEILKCSDKISEDLKSRENLLTITIEEGLVSLSRFVLDIVYKDLYVDKETAEEKRLILTNILINLKDEKKFLDLLSDIRTVNETNFIKFLLLTDYEGNSVFNIIFEKTTKIVKKFIDMLYKNSGEKQWNDTDLECLLLHKNGRGETGLFHLLNSSSRTKEKTELLLNLIIKQLKENRQRDLIKTKEVLGDNILHILHKQDEETYKIVFSFVEKLLGEEMKTFLEVTNGNQNNILHLAAIFAKTLKHFEFLWQKVSKIIENQKSFLMLKGISNRNILQFSVTNRNDPKLFEFVFHLARQLCTEQEFEDLLLKVDKKNENVLTLAVQEGRTETLQFLFSEILKWFFEFEIYNILKKYDLVTLVILNENIEAVKFMWNFFESILSSDEMFELINKEDDNILHLAASKVKSKEILIFLFKRIEMLLLSDTQMWNYVMRKASFGRNILLIAIKDKNENSFFYIIEYILRFEINKILYDCDDDNENFFHYLAQFGTHKMLKHIFEQGTTLSVFEKLRERNSQIFEELLMARSDNGNNILHFLVLSNSRLDSIEYFQEVIVKLLSDKNIEKLIFGMNKEQMFPLSYAESTGNGILEVFLKFGESHKEIFQRMLTLHGKIVRDRVPFSKDIRGASWNSPSTSKDAKMGNDSKGYSLSDLNINAIVEKIISKCFSSSKRSVDLNGELTEKIKIISVDPDMCLLLEVIASYDSIFFDFDCDEKKVRSLSYLLNFPEYGEGFIYVIINCENKEEKFNQFVYEVVRFALEIVLGREEILLKNHSNFKNALESLKQQLNIESNQDVSLFKVFANYFSKKLKSRNEPDHNYLLAYFNDLVGPHLIIPNGNANRAANKTFDLLNSYEYSTIKLNSENRIELKNFKKNTFLKSNIPHAVLERFYQELIKQDVTFNAKNVFLSLDLLEFDEAYTKFKEVASSTSLERIFVDATTVNENLIKILLDAEPKAKIIMVGYEDAEIKEFKNNFAEIKTENFTWSDLSNETQIYLGNKRINFQNHQKRFSDIFTFALDKMPSSMLQTLCSDKQLEINSELNIKDFIAVPREFKIKNKTFYREPKFFNYDFFYSNNTSIDDVMKRVETSRQVLMIGDENSGLTNAMMNIAMKLNQKGIHVKYIKHDGDDISEESFLGFLKLHINDKSLELLLQNGQSIIFIDGIKIFSVQLKNLLTSFLNSFQGNQLWLSLNEETSCEVERHFENIKIKLAAPTSKQINQFLSDPLASLSLNTFSTLQENEKSFLYHHALRVFFNTDIIFGLRCPANFAFIHPALIFDANGHISFSNIVHVDFLIAHFILNCLKYIDKISGHETEFFNFFKNILEQEHLTGVCLILNSLLSYGSFSCTEKNQKKLGNCLKRAMKTLSGFKGVFEKFDLCKLIIRILSYADWGADIKNSDYPTIVCNILKCTIPNGIHTTHPLIPKITDLFSTSIIDKHVLQVPNNGDTLYHFLAKCSQDGFIIGGLIDKFGFNSIANNKDFSLYKISIEQENEDLFNVLLEKCSIDLKQWEKLVDVTFDMEDYRFLAKVFQHGEQKFTNHIFVNAKKEEINRITVGFANLHECIRNKKKTEILDFIINNSKYKVFKGINENSRCALEVALEFYDSDIYKILIEKGLRLCRQCNMADHYKHLVFCKNIRNAEKSKNDELYLLISKCLNAKSPSPSVTNELINMVVELFEYSNIKNILKTIANTDVEIIFINRENVGEFDLNHSTFVGTYNPSLNIMLITKCSNIAEQYGTFIHEATHCAFQALYKNDCKPYLKEDVDRENEFKNITHSFKENYRQNINNENLEAQIASVFRDYPESRHEAELTVRFPQLLTSIRKEWEIKDVPQVHRINGYTEETLKLERKLQKLADFHYKRASKDLDIENGVPLRQLNDDFGLWDKIAPQIVSFEQNVKLKELINDDRNLIINSEYPNLVLRCIFAILNEKRKNENSSLLNFKTENLFLNLKKMQNNESLFKKLLRFIRSKNLKRIIVFCNGVTFSNEFYVLLASRHKLILVNVDFALKDYFQATVSEVKFSSASPNFSVNNDIHLFTVALKKNAKWKNHEPKIMFQSQPILFSNLPIFEFFDEDELSILNEMDLKSIIINEMPTFINQQQKVQKFNVEQPLNTALPIYPVRNWPLQNLIPFIEQNNKKFTLISSPIGSGRTEALKYIYNYLLNINTNKYWYSNISEEDILNFDLFSKQFKSEVENKFFKAFKKANKVIFLIDGIDRLTLEAQTQLIDNLKNDECVHVFITCGVHLEETLKSQLGDNHLLVSLFNLHYLKQNKIIKEIITQNVTEFVLDADISHVIKWRILTPFPFLSVASLIIHNKAVHEWSRLNKFEMHLLFNNYIYEKYFKLSSVSLLNFYYIQFSAAIEVLPIKRNFWSTFNAHIRQDHIKHPLINYQEEALSNKSCADFWIAKFVIYFLLESDDFPNQDELLVFLSEIINNPLYSKERDMLSWGIEYTITTNANAKGKLETILPNLQTNHQAIYEYFRILM